ncbi:MAG: hypothetical protein HY748_15375 [Elusimicrobia bacterium]|nr:hypothetical protein [Elusimicrobiota bacterium]
MIASLYYKIFLVLGLVVSFEDWTEKRIRNHWIGLGLVACAAGLAYLLWNSFTGYRHMAAWGGGHYYLPWRYYPKVLAHVVLCATASFTLWRFNVWPAGDAKLYILFGLFAAIIDPNIPGFPLLLFMVMLVNVFVPAGIFFATETVLRVLPGLRAVAQIEWGKWLKALVERAWIRLKDAWPFRYRYLTLCVNLLALFFGMIVLGARFRQLSLGPFGQLLIFLALLVVWSRAMGLLQNHTIGVVALLCLATVVVGGTVTRHWLVWAWLVSAMKMTLNFGLFISFARILFDWLIEWDSRLRLDPDGLKPGVILSDESWARLKAAPELEGKLGERYSDGLTAEEASAIKGWLAQRDAHESYTVYRTIPFAVWIFMGTLLTLYYRGSALVLLSPYYGRLKAALKAALSGWFS